MKKLIATFAVCMAFSMPAMAITLTEGQITKLDNDVLGYIGDETGSQRVVRLLNELTYLADTGNAYGQRWEIITAAAYKEGWEVLAEDHIDTLNPVSNVYTAVKEFLDMDPASDEIIEYEREFGSYFKSGNVNEIDLDLNSTMTYDCNAGCTSTVSIPFISKDIMDGETWLSSVDIKAQSFTETYSDSLSNVENAAKAVDKVWNAATEKLLEDTIKQAFDQGYDKGFQDGFKAGWKAAEEHHGIN